ncbi:type II CAAX endopeptidase family protein [Thermoleptolyngbya sp. C42_A2020_037]|uniref:CPBP family intramembrane glutamic endopeptidase n=1 Tax=Thermoleptolyngbya sp. C42_A2020_037 TaxID=2747799 RepID=UPI0019E8EA56|nr:type II CAAX endopeptidase family protein [Thermoleptolyngbya sp. C42_A2020_037]MBF2084460.1 CPBP family intramembrane metalloprotease [Thermoleptolyngbya sp. C42_A2020_037]
MTLKRLILSVLTLFVAILVGGSLWSSFQEPQITNRLQLYQTNLLLHATAATEITGEVDGAALQKALLGESPLKTALEQYQAVRKAAEADLAKLEKRLATVDPAALGDSGPPPAASARPIPSRTVDSQATRLTTALQQQRSLLDQLDLSIGILQAEQGDLTAAQQTWGKLAESTAADNSAAGSPAADTARTLTGLWNEPPRIVPDAEMQLQKGLEGWFRYTALDRLYSLQQRTEALNALRAEEAAIAQGTLVKLALVGTVPVLGAIAGAGLLVFLVAQRLTQGKQSILALNGEVPWDVPWDWEIIWQVLIVGFFMAGQVVAPLIVGVLSPVLTAFGPRAKAVYAFTYYLLMAGSGLAVLYWSIRKWIPLPKDWFQYRVAGRWPLWGLGGYLVALPLMIGVSLVNQQIWQGQGGSNPLLQIVLEEGDAVSLGLFLFTAAVAAPIFEETLFRGFLLPSLTRYMPVWGAIALSSLLFAVAHLSLSEVIPLTTLGAVLGMVYTRSRNLLAPILLHSLWNAITMIGLFVLGSGARL